MSRRTFVLLGVAAALVLGYATWDMVLARRLMMGGGGAFVVPGGPMELAKVYYTTTQDVPHNTNTVMTMDSVESDPAGYWSAGSPTKLTVPTGKGGVPFLVMGGSFTLLDPAQDVIMFVQVNGSDGVRGSTRSYPQTGTNNNPVGYIATEPVPVVLQDGDYIELVIYIDNAAGPGTFGFSGNSPTWLALVRLANP